MHPDYFTVDLPFFWTHYITITDATKISELFINLNSPYNPIITAGVDRSDHQPAGRDTWSNIYDFYRVLESDTNIKFSYLHGYFGSNEPTGGGGAPYEVGIVPNHILTGYTITDDVTAKPANYHEFVESKHTKVMQLHPTNYDIISSTASAVADPSEVNRLMCNGGTNSCSFHYAPENWDYHVTQTGVEERWTPVDSSPEFKHYLGITAAAPGEYASDDKVTVRVDVYQTFKVQWREVGTVLKYNMDTDQ